MKLINRFFAFPFILMIKVYQVVVSPLFPASCRFQPTCSAYTLEAIKEWGILKGGWLGIKRIFSCRPGGKSGYDPVPKR